ncbi:uncharacterized protein LOC131255787 [Magnolia sinica]|uniref:uncharacterized protein LOC131255787 n=1 Tax=Magnolia sinica TaxID=86752 RepID=UPI00265A2DEF|nr:uncharacterized protein LOC131255787 [Magnolia sinica]
MGRSEKTKVRSALSCALVSTLVALATINLSIIASEVPVYSVVLEYLLPVAVHLLLFRADLRRILQSIGTLLLVFWLGSGLKVRFCKSGEAYECRTILLCDAHQLDCEVFCFQS